MFDHIAGHSNPAKLKHKTNHHKRWLQLNMSSNVLLPQASPCQQVVPSFTQIVKPLYSLFLSFFSILHIQSFSISFKFYIQFFLSLSLLTTPTTLIPIQATVISCLEDNNKPHSSYPHSNLHFLHKEAKVIFEKLHQVMCLPCSKPCKSSLLCLE